MFIAKVTGSLVSTQKLDSIVGYKLLMVEPYRLDAETRKKLITTGRTFVAVDTLGAGEGDFVLIAQGSSARLTPETQKMPIDPPHYRQRILEWQIAHFPARTRVIAGKPHRP